MAYAFYGVLKTINVDIAVADYSLPYGVVYHQFLTSLLAWEKSYISLLVLCGRNNDGNMTSAEAPTWVPDWSTPKSDTGWPEISFAYNTNDNSSTHGSNPRSMVHGNYLIVRELSNWHTLFNLASGTTWSHRDDTEVVDYVVSGLLKSMTARNYFTRCMGMLAQTHGLFSTSEGYIGTGPLGMRKGDLIALVAGVALPLVLRRKGHTIEFEVVGPAVIRGAMDGGLWRGTGADDAAREIVLV
ncbi:hypothetical protein B0T17DRAFT_639422 [Bombardia bombarda]|uniref:Uncharacterized protein n=1 Tax=Bombardia bombarda TaxID=252184 RepID=A0AA39X0L1_9PEZI|nr:hypothetical protein B0T17DRAFT_639422 [Bombardia bombarda]